MSSFGFDIETVFNRRGSKKKRSKKKNGMDSMMDVSMKDMGLGVDVLGIGGDFGERIGTPAGRANGRQGGFLDIIGMQQFQIAPIAGREPTVAGARRAKRARGKVQPRGRGTTKFDSPLTGLEGLSQGVGGLGRVQRTVTGDVRTIRKGIGRLREARKLTKERKTEEKRAKALKLSIRREEERRRRPALPEDIPSRPTPLSGLARQPALPDLTRRTAI